jgi:transposase
MSIRQLALPIECDTYIPKDANVCILDELLNQIVPSIIFSKTSCKVSTLTLLKIVIFGYMEGVTSVRAIEKACQRDIHFRWLLQNEPAPSKSTIARFIKANNESITQTFYHLIHILAEENEINFDTVFVDGTKIEANANKYSFVWRKAIDKYEQRLNDKIVAYIDEINVAYQTTFSPNDLRQCLDFLTNQTAENNIDFVYGKGKRKSTLQKHYEKAVAYLEKKQKYIDYQRTFNGRNSFSKSDHDATFMHLKEDHMRNAQLKPAYNMQIAVNSEYIVGLDVSAERSDQLTLIPLLEKLNQHLPEKYQSVTADAGYESEENYDYLHQHQQTSYIKPQNYEQRKKKRFKKQIGRRENMTYDAKTDSYICVNNQPLSFVKETYRRSKSGYKAHIKIYECSDCSDCSMKAICTKSKNNKQLWVADHFLAYRNESLRNVTSNQGIHYRINRSIQVEGAFGVLKQDYGFRRLKRRGFDMVRTEFTLQCLAYNINKYCNKKHNNRCGSHLHLQLTG